jgi:hypothetical protein
VIIDYKEVAGMTKQDYEILPHSLLEDLKYDVEALKKKLQEPDTKTNELILEIESLKDSIHELNDVFKKALDTTADEDIFKSIKHLNERIDAVVTQNETIARGMIAISDKIEQFTNSSKPVAAVQSIPSANTGMPSNMQGGSFSAPPNMMSAGVGASMVPPLPTMGSASVAGIGGIPPPPPGLEKSKKRHGFF